MLEPHLAKPGREAEQMGLARAPAGYAVKGGRGFLLITDREQREVMYDHRKAGLSTVPAGG